MEMGSFIELQFLKGMEFYNQEKNIARLNSGRVAIYHAVRCLGCDTLWLPYYQCNTVRDFLKCKNICIRYYYIDKLFNPIDLNQKKGEAVLFVDYFGIMSRKRMAELANEFDNVIIDNSQAFFCKPLDNCMNVYSCRKFIGVPDGAYVIGRNAEMYVNEYPQCFSSDTSHFLLQRIEYGCEGKAYENRRLNERRIDSEDIMQMSKLTHAILNGTDYQFICDKRKENFEYACTLFNSYNRIDVGLYMDEDCVPMVYPLVIEDDSLIERLQQIKHFQGHWWSYLLDEVPENSFEYWISRYVVPMTIDQRYGKEDLDLLLLEIMPDEIS